jgi:serine protease Do
MIGMRAGKVLAWALVAAVVAVPACKTKSSGGEAGSSGTSAGGPTSLPTGAIPVTSASPAPESTPATASPPLVMAGSAPLSFAPIAKKANPSVVTITTVVEETEPDVFGRTRRRVAKGLGTGFVVDKDGVILTNNHVIDEAKAIAVKLSDDRELPGTLVGRDPRTDVAVVRIDPKGGAPLVPLSLGDSDTMEVGDWVVAIGNPFGLSHTVSAGIISAKGRSKEEVELDPSGYYNFLQTDASINPGNSGGPLLNLKGEVVGINTAIRAGGAQGIGFAIPVNMVKQLLPMLLRDGHVTRSAMGVRVRDVHELSPEDKAAVKRPDDKGVVIAMVEPGGPADKVGLAPYDVILNFDGQAVDRSAQLQWLASMAGVGKTVTLRVSREGKVFDLKLTLGQLKDAPPPRRGAGP